MPTNNPPIKATSADIKKERSNKTLKRYITIDQPIITIEP